MRDKPLLATPKPWRRRVASAKDDYIVFTLDRAHARARDRLRLADAHGIGFT